MRADLLDENCLWDVNTVGEFTTCEPLSDIPQTGGGDPGPADSGGILGSTISSSMYSDWVQNSKNRKL